MAQESTDSRLGGSLRRLRRDAGLTQAAAAQRAGIGISALRLLEQGQGTLQSWRRALAALDLELRGRSLAAGATGVALAALRRRRRLSIRAVARTLGVNRATIAALERDGPGRLATLEAYGAAIGAGLYLARRDAPRAFFTHAGNSSAHHGFRTPAHVLRPLYEAIGGPFDLDPCAATADPRRASVKARLRLTAEDDGLSHAWRGTVFCNPPYGRALPLWMAKCRQEAATGRAIVIALIPARPDAGWWHEHVVGHADIILLRGRIRFQGAENSAPFPSAIAVWGAAPALAGRIATGFPGAWHVARPAASGDTALAPT